MVTGKVLIPEIQRRGGSPLRGALRPLVHKSPARRVLARMSTLFVLTGAPTSLPPPRLRTWWTRAGGLLVWVKGGGPRLPILGKENCQYSLKVFDSPWLTRPDARFLTFNEVGDS